MIPLTDIPQQYHDALAAERVDVAVHERAGGAALHDKYRTLLHADSLYRVTALRWASGRVTVEGSAADIVLPHTPRNVRALAVVLATACGLDASAGVTAGLVYVHAPHTDGLWIATADGARHAFWGNRTVPALSTIDPTHPDALLRALAECLRALTETTA